jgi:hypothetical protein
MLLWGPVDLQEHNQRSEYRAEDADSTSLRNVGVCLPDRRDSELNDSQH